MTVSRPSLRIRRGRWPTRALAASPTAAEPTARCSTGVRRAPKNSSAMARRLLFALLRFLCRPGRWSTRLKLQRPPEGSAQVDGNVAKIDLAARGVDGLVHFNAPSWAVRAVMSSNTLPVCPKTGSTSPSLTVHLCLHTVPGNRECAPGWIRGLQARAGALWARVEWTARAAAMLKAREYRYISPTFFHARNGTVKRIEGAALTNCPALVMPAPASNGVAVVQAGNAGGDPDAPLTADELAARRSLGISDEQFKESRAADLERATAWG